MFLVVFQVFYSRLSIVFFDGFSEFPQCFQWFQCSVGLFLGFFYRVSSV